MNVEELINKEIISPMDIIQLIESENINNLTTKDLDKLIEKTKGEVIRYDVFPFVYDVISTKESNKTLIRWTITTGVLTVIVTIATLVNLYLFISTQ